MIFTIANTKGGAGKTTTAVHLAAMLARTSPTLLIDGDPQASAASWAAWRRESGRLPSPTTTCLVGKAILTEGKDLAAGFAHTVVDAGGRDSAALRASLLLAQRAIIPVGASNFDAAAMTDLLEGRFCPTPRKGKTSLMPVWFVAQSLGPKGRVGIAGGQGIDVHF